jgi:hypothetical protein
MKGSMSSDARDFNNIETRAVFKFFLLQVKAPKEIHIILRETLGEHAPSLEQRAKKFIELRREYVE